MEALRERLPDLWGRTHSLSPAGSRKRKALLCWLHSERARSVPYSSRSWRWESRGAEWWHLSCLEHRKSLVWEKENKSTKLKELGHIYNNLWCKKAETLLHGFLQSVYVMYCNSSNLNLHSHLCRRLHSLWSWTPAQRCATSGGLVRAAGAGCAGRRLPEGCRSDPRESTTLSSWGQRWGSRIHASGRWSRVIKDEQRLKDRSVSL